MSEAKPLSSVADITMGQSPPGEHVVDGIGSGIPFLQGCAEFGARTPNPLKSCRGRTRVARRGAALVSVRAPVGAMNVADRDYGIGRGLAALVARPGVLQTYLNYAVTAAAPALARLSQGSTFDAIGSRELRRLEVLVPKTLDEQSRIADLLTAVDEQVDCAEAQIAKEKLRFVGLQQSLLSCSRLRDSEIDNVLLRQLVPVVQYGISTSLETHGVIPVLRMNNLSAGEVDVSDMKHSPLRVSSDLVLRDGDVLFNRTNSMEHVGRTSIWRSQLPVATFASYLVRLHPDESRMTKAYLVYLLSWAENQTQMRRYATPGVQQVNINPTSLRRCRVRVPRSLDTQREIVVMLDASREHIASLVAEVEKLRLQKQGLARDLLTGKVRMPA